MKHLFGKSLDDKAREMNEQTLKLKDDQVYSFEKNEYLMKENLACHQKIGAKTEAFLTYIFEKLYIN
jgi:hypothetical protein